MRVSLNSAVFLSAQKRTHLPNYVPELSDRSGRLPLDTVCCNTSSNVSKSASQFSCASLMERCGGHGTGSSSSNNNNGDDGGQRAGDALMPHLYPSFSYRRTIYMSGGALRCSQPSGRETRDPEHRNGLSACGRRVAASI